MTAACPYCFEPVTRVEDVEGWPVLHPCGHPVPVERSYWDAFRGGVAQPVDV